MFQESSLERNITIHALNLREVGGTRDPDG